MSSSDLPQGEPPSRSGAREANRLLGTIATVGLVGIAAYASQFPRSTGWSVFAVAIAAAGAALLVGSLVGLLFGIPRVQPGDRPSEEDEQAAGGSSNLTYSPNTNLVQVSDWLTKILVGVGLIQIGNLGAAAATLGNALRPGLGDLSSSSSFGVALVIYFLMLGFIGGYIETRTVLSAAFREADVRGLTAFISTRITQKIESIQQRDARALSLVQQLIEPSSDQAGPSEDELTRALREASAPVKVQSFMTARDARRKLRTKDPHALERVIPLFKALINIDTEGRYHRNHGQLAYILKDRQPPNCDEAIAELTRAIEIRDKEGDTDRYRLYEFNRAECRILTVGPSPEFRESIFADLRVAAREHYLMEKIGSTPAIRKWLDDNGIAIDQLTADS